jgi:rRNA maturation endonuclease Nob1
MATVSSPRDSGINVTLSECKIFILDSTAFIRLDFPKLIDSQTFKNASFFSTTSISFELKDFRSRMNIEILKESKRLKLITPQTELLEKIKMKISRIDPNTTLSTIDIEILALSQQLGGTIISNDLNLQNAAAHLKIPFKILTGKKITHLRKWKLKCYSCGRSVKNDSQLCPHCGGRLKKVLVKNDNLGEKQRE